MKKPASLFTLLCIVVFFLFAAFMAWYIPSAASLRSSTAETKQALETSRGRENKQQDEYDKAAGELPVVQAELAEKQPLAEQAEQNVTALKARRKELREEKKKLEAGLSPDTSSDSGSAAEPAEEEVKSDGN